MKWRVELLEADKVVRLEAVGLGDVKALTEVARQALETAREHGFGKFLADGRQMTLSASLVRLYNLPTVLERQGFSRTQKVAMLCSNEPGQQDTFQFLENIFVNRGYEVRLFRDYSDAMKWLKSSSEPLTTVGPETSNNNGV